MAKVTSKERTIEVSGMDIPISTIRTIRSRSFIQSLDETDKKLLKAVPSAAEKKERVKELVANTSIGDTIYFKNEGETVEGVVMDIKKDEASRRPIQIQVKGTKFKVWTGWGNLTTK